MPKTSPNVVLFMVDGHRADQLGCYGGSLAQTPCIDALAAQGVLCRNAFAVHSVCMPTRASVYTGCYPHVHGVWANGVPLPSGTMTLADLLRRAGYATAACGKVHFEPQQAYLQQRSEVSDGVRALAPWIRASADRPYYGFEEVHLSENLLGAEYVEHVRQTAPAALGRVLQRQTVPESLHDGTWITDQAIGFIQRQVSADRPFFCHVSFHELTPPCAPPQEFAGCVDPAAVVLPEMRSEDLARRPAWYRQCYEGYCRRGRQPDAAALRRAVASCHDHMRFIDKQFGRLVQTLRQAGVWDSTIVLYTTDHGLSLCDHWQWRHGPFLFDEVVHIPMIWRVPDLAPAAVSCPAFFEQVDILPTLLECCRVDLPPRLQGTSLVDVLRRPQTLGMKDAVFVQERQAPDLMVRGVNPADIIQYGVRTREHKLIAYEGVEFGELYDLVNDPGEFYNRWDDLGYRDVRRALEDRLRGYLRDWPKEWPVRRFDW